MCTYFNSFSFAKWKKYTNIEHVSFFIKFQGKVKITITNIFNDLSSVDYDFTARSNGDDYQVCNLTEHLKAGTVDLDAIFNGEDQDPQIIGVKVTALEDSIIQDFGYFSKDPITQPNVKIGIGITTFKREKDCVAACKRLTASIANSDFYKDKISVTVVDNGNTITREMIPDFVKLIPNRNLGGSGGFTRNLVHYKDEGSYTHCLFMDDDASCYAESIYRTYQFLSHVKDDKVAISGAMFSANLQFLQWENGAYFDGCCHPLHCHFDMRDPALLVKNEFEDCDQPTYGAWWYFAFPIKHVTHYVFPFFVRGDDVQFSYINDFTIVRMNGICTWQEDFKLKEGPMTFYLDVRSHLMHHILLPHLNSNPIYVMKFIYNFFMRTFCNGYFYDTASVVNLAIKHVMKGPKYWEKNLETVELRKQIKQMTKIEVPSKEGYNLNSLPYADNILHTKYFPNFLKKYSCNGHFLPNSMFDTTVYKINKYNTVDVNRAYLRKTLVVYNPINNTQFTLQKNTWRYLKLMIGYFWLAFLFILRARSLRKTYRKYFDKEFTTDAKWKSFFKSK